jgi:phosphatidylserine synthase
MPTLAGLTTFLVFVSVPVLSQLQQLVATWLVMLVIFVSGLILNRIESMLLPSQWLACQMRPFSNV